MECFKGIVSFVCVFPIIILFYLLEVYIQVNCPIPFVSREQLSLHNPIDVARLASSSQEEFSLLTFIPLGCGGTCDSSSLLLQPSQTCSVVVGGGGSHGDLTSVSLSIGQHQEQFQIPTRKVFRDSFWEQTLGDC